MSSSIRPLLLAILAFGAILGGHSGRAQQPVPAPAADRQLPVPTFRTSTDFVAVDVVVTDEEGRHVTDLTADDFEVLHQGERCPVRHLLYLRGTPWTEEQQAALTAPLGPAPSTPAATPGVSLLAPSGIRPEDVRRAMALVVDDLSLSFRSTVDVRRALGRFLDDQMQSGDLVAVVRTSAGEGALQQFTTDQRILREAVDRVQFSFTKRGRVEAFGPVEPAAYSLGAISQDPEDTVEGLRDNMLVAGSLGALRTVIRGIQELPGRKSVVFFSDGFDVFDRQGSTRAWTALLRAIESANAAGVVIYAIDARGLQAGGLTAEDNPQVRTGGVSPSFDTAERMFNELVRGAAQGRRQELLNTQQSLEFLARQTGGFAVINNNDLNLGLRRVLDDQQGYYLLGYELPPDAGKAGPGDNVIRVKVKRPDLRVRARNGLFGPAMPGVPVPADADTLLRAALSPFAATGIPARLTTLFAQDPERGPFLRSRLLVDSRALHPEANDQGERALNLEILTITVDEDGGILAYRRRPLTVGMSADEEPGLLASGLVYDQWVPLPRPGAYHVRVAVRESNTGRLGAASEFVIVPDVASGQLSLSGLVVRDAGDRVPAGVSAPSTPGEVPSTTLAQGDPALRVFPPGARLAYALEVYNAIEPKAQQADLTVGVTLWRGQQAVRHGTAAPIRLAGTSLRRGAVPVVGELVLDPTLPAGFYTLEISVTDPRDGRKARQASRWIDIEVRARG